jgi:hypothetical protein
MKSTWRSGWSGSILLILMAGCEHVGVRVDPPNLPAPPSVECDLVRAESVGITTLRQGEGVLAVRLTNKSDKPISMGGDSGAVIPAKDGVKARLVYRGEENLDRFLGAASRLELRNGELKVSVDLPEAGMTVLPPGESRVVLVAFQAPPGAAAVSVDVSPLLRGESVHSPDGKCRAMYLDVPIVDGKTIMGNMKTLIEQTRFGFQVTSDDF